MWSGKAGLLGIIPGEFNTEDEEEEENTIGRNRTGNCHSGETVPKTTGIPRGQFCGSAARR